MAVTKIWAIHDSVSRVVDYCTNPSKTKLSDLEQVLLYAADKGKTLDEGEQQYAVTGIGCRAESAAREMLFSVMDSDEVTPSLSQARRLRRMSEAQTLTDDAVLQLLSEVKGNQVEYVKVPVDKLRSFFRPDTSVKQMTETLVKAMDFYNKHLARQRKDRDAR